MKRKDTVGKLASFVPEQRRETLGVDVALVASSSSADSCPTERAADVCDVVVLTHDQLNEKGDSKI